MLLNISTFLLTIIFVIIVIILYLIIRALGGLKKLHPFYFVLVLTVMTIVFSFARQGFLDYTYKHFPYMQPDTEWVSDSGTITISVSDEKDSSDQYGDSYNYEIYLMVADDCYTASIASIYSGSALPLGLLVDDNLNTEDNWPFEDRYFSFNFRMSNEHTLILTPKYKENAAILLAGQDRIVLTRVDEE